ncbi:Arm DNA-binding domain-containing protein [Parasedimentitalea psychrophila]|nr:Arm DNA-binding domain-containing protein [Parasedimentitalea psychrophila]
MTRRSSQTPLEWLISQCGWTTPAFRSPERAFLASYAANRETRDQSSIKNYPVAFWLRVMPTRTKTYQAQYRKGGRTRGVSIGRHGKTTVDEARKLAKEVIGQVTKTFTTRPAL